jgi:hypothetical protein
MTSTILLIVTFCLTNAALASDYVSSGNGPSYTTGQTSQSYTCNTSTDYVSQEKGRPYVIADQIPACEAPEEEETGFINIEEQDGCVNSFGDAIAAKLALQKRVCMHTMVCMMGMTIFLPISYCSTIYTLNSSYNENWLNNYSRLNQELIEMLSKYNKAFIDSKTDEEYIERLKALVNKTDQDSAK